MRTRFDIQHVVVNSTNGVHCIGQALINHCYIVFRLSLTSGKGEITWFSHDKGVHPTVNCLGCSNFAVLSSFYRDVYNFKNQLFQQLIHHPAVRLHWVMINPSDYD